MGSLLALHDFTMNAAGLRHMMAALEPRLSVALEVVYVGAPHDASEGSVEGLAPDGRAAPQAAEPRVVAGLRRRPRVSRLEREPRALAERPGAGLLGFSQGAAFAAALAGAASRGELPAPAFVILVAGFLPRAPELGRLFDAPVRVPSLHVLGDAPLARHGPALFERFDPETRALVRWPGRHRIPGAGPAADAIVEFALRHAGARASPGR